MQILVLTFHEHTDKAIKAQQNRSLSLGQKLFFLLRLPTRDKPFIHINPISFKIKYIQRELFLASFGRAVPVARDSFTRGPSRRVLLYEFRSGIASTLIHLVI